MDLRSRRHMTSGLVVIVLGFAGFFSAASAQTGQRGGQSGAAPAGQQGGRGGQQRRDAREMAPEALIGTWVQNMEKSKYDPGPNNLKSQVRQFDYTMDGMIL